MNNSTKIIEVVVEPRTLSPDQTDPGYCCPVIRTNSDRTDPRRAALQFDPEPVPLREPLKLFTRGGARYRLVAGSVSDGVLVPADLVPSPACHARLVLCADDPALDTVQVVLQVLGPAGAAYRDAAGAVRVRWLTITATQRRAYLVAALQRMLGVGARVCVRDDVLGPHRKLVYNPRRMQVSLVNVGTQALPRPGSQGGPSSRRRSQAVTDLAPAERVDDGRRNKRATRPFVLVDSGRMSEGSRSILDKPQPGPAPLEPSIALGAATADESGLSEYLRVSTGEMPAPGPVIRRSKGRGCYTQGGQLRGMDCAWVGRTHVAFETPSAPGIAPGAVVSVGVPGSPASNNVIWVVGEVARVEALQSGRFVVEVDLRRNGNLPMLYRALVAYWETQSDYSAG